MIRLPEAQVAAAVSQAIIGVKERAILVLRVQSATIRGIRCSPSFWNLDFIDFRLSLRMCTAAQKRWIALGAMVPVRIYAQRAAWAICALSASKGAYLFHSHLCCPRALMGFHYLWAGTTREKRLRGASHRCSIIASRLNIMSSNLYLAYRRIIVSSARPLQVYSLRGCQRPLVARTNDFLRCGGRIGWDRVRKSSGHQSVDT